MKKTDIEIIREEEKEMERMGEVEAFDFMKKRNLSAARAPWGYEGWEKRKEHCSICGSNTIFERQSDDGILRIVQCMSAVRHYSKD